jgi:hypothetical protein
VPDLRIVGQRFAFARPSVPDMGMYLLPERR